MALVAASVRGMSFVDLDAPIKRVGAGGAGAPKAGAVPDGDAVIIDIGARPRAVGEDGVVMGFDAWQRRGAMLGKAGLADIVPMAGLNRRRGRFRGAHRGRGGNRPEQTAEHKQQTSHDRALVTGHCLQRLTYSQLRCEAGLVSLPP